MTPRRLTLRRHAWMLLCCALPPLVLACGPTDDPGGTGDRPSEVAPIEPALPPPAESLVAHMLVGELLSVDPDRRRLRVGTSDGAFEVAYTAETEIVDRNRAVRGLAATPGDRVTVHYRPDPVGVGRVAIRIETRAGTSARAVAY